MTNEVRFFTMICLAGALSACGGKSGTTSDQSGDIANVQLAVGLSAPAAQGFAARAGFDLSGPGRSAGASFTDVTRIAVDITNLSVTPNRVVFHNVNLEPQPDGLWTTTLPFLPRAAQLQFSAHAFNAAGAEMFNGTAIQVLNGNNGRVTIGLDTYDNNHTLAVPRITRISVPAEFASGASNSVTVGVEGSTGEVIDFNVTPDPLGGEIFPRSGRITLAGVSGSLVFQFQAPVLDSDASFTHTVEISNARGTTVRATFSTAVRRRGTVDSVINTNIRVQFRPIINNFTAQRVGLTSNVLVSADVTDDNPVDQDQLSYAWTFIPASGQTFSPAPAFTAAARTTTLTNYSVAVAGTIRLTVTDADDGTTTLNYTLPANQFPDDLIGNSSGGGVSSIEAGGTHTCALLSNANPTATGGIRCWGRSNYGQLGYGNTTTYGAAANALPYVAGTIPNLEPALQIATGAEHSCALFNNGQIACWGRNDYGQLGYATTAHVGDTEAVASFGYVNTGGNAIRIAAGGNHTCALMDTGNVRCWGRNDYGQLGYGNKNNVGDDESPYAKGDVSLGGARVRDITVGEAHTCVLFEAGGVRCWGLNDAGQLGYGNTSNVGDDEIPLATNVDIGGTVMQISAGSRHTCALLTNGALRCWGLNGNGQLGYPDLYVQRAYYPYDWYYKNYGDKTNEAPASHGDIDLGVGRVGLQVAAGATHTCVILDTGGVRCWGGNAYGQLGQGNTTQLNAPSAADVRLGASAVRLSAGNNHNCALLTSGGVRCWGQGAFGQLGYGNTNSIGDNEQADAAGPVQIMAP